MKYASETRELTKYITCSFFDFTYVTKYFLALYGHNVPHKVQQGRSTPQCWVSFAWVPYKVGHKVTHKVFSRPLKIY